MTDPVTYHTLNQAVAIYGDDYVRVAFDANGDGDIDLPYFAMHARLAAQQIEGYLLGQYTLPLETPPQILSMYSLDLAIYNACPDASRRTDEITKRAERAIRYLEMVGKGTLKFEVSPNTPASSLTRVVDIDIASADDYDPDARQFTSASLRGLV